MGAVAGMRGQLGRLLLAFLILTPLYLAAHVSIITVQTDSINRVSQALSRPATAKALQAAVPKAHDAEAVSEPGAISCAMKASGFEGHPGEFSKPVLWDLSGPIVMQNRLRAISGCLRDVYGSGLGQALAGQLSGDPASDTGELKTVREDVQLLQNNLAPSPLKLFFGYEQYVCYLLALWAGLVSFSELRRLSHLLTKLQPNRLDPYITSNFITLNNVNLILQSLPDQRTRDDVLESAEETLRRFEASKDVAAAERTAAQKSDAIVNRANAVLTPARFAVFAIPSIGFLGTVRGISDALGRADDPDRLPEIVGALGVAFDTTLVALLLILPLTALIYVTQHRSEVTADGLSELIGRRIVSILRVA